MTQPAANNARARREKPTARLTGGWIDKGLMDRLKAHLETRGLVQTKFIERAIEAQLALEGHARAPVES